MFVILAALAAWIAGAGGFALGWKHSVVDRGREEPATRPESGGEVVRDVESDVADEIQRVDEWLQRFDRVHALSLRRRHLELVDVELAKLPIPPVLASPPLAAALDEWAAIRRARGDASGAEELDRRARELDPEPVRARIRDAAASGDAVSLRALAKSPSSSEWDALSLALLGRALVAVEAADVAIRLLDRAIDRFSDDFELHLALADAHFRRGPPDAEHARRHYIAAQALRPDSVRVAARHGMLCTEQGGAPSDGVAVIEAAARRLPDDPIVALLHGIVLFKARHSEEGRQKLRRALDLDESLALAHATLAEIAVDQQEWDRAERASRRGLTIADTPDARDALAAALIGRKDSAGAILLLEESVRRHPDDAQLRDRFANALVLAGRHQEAMAHLKESVRLDEWIAEAQNDYAWELVNSGEPSLRRPGQALEHTQRACEMEPRNAWFRNTLGVTHYRLGDFARAQAELEHACELPAGGGPYDLFFLAMAKHELGLEEDARAHFARAIELLDQRWDVAAASGTLANVEELARLRAEAEALLERDPGGGP